MSDPMILSDPDLPNGGGGRGDVGMVDDKALDGSAPDEKHRETVTAAVAAADEVQPPQGPPPASTAAAAEAAAAAPPQEDKPLATDDEAVKARFMPANPDLETIDEAKHTFHVERWKSQGKKEHGPSFPCAGTPWRLLMFPFGNNNNSDSCSLYLEHAYPDKPPEDWYACVEFLFVMANPNDASVYTTNTAHHRFNADATDWGFTRFVDLHKMLLPWEGSERPLLEGDSVIITVHVRVVKDPTGVLWHTFENYDSKKETGMVGLKNQGATCYLNSLLQSLYLTNAFRKAIYQIPTAEETVPRNNSAYALQRLFYFLQHSEAAVSTGELTSSFGWDSRQIFEQQDVQELSRILMDRMEARMKGTESESALGDLFVGATKTFLECINVDYESSSSQVFWDIQLNVKGNQTLDDSFRDCNSVETMDGENKYFAEGFGLQDARKGDIFERFPAVLHLQLKRFEYNWQYDTTTKIHDRFEFPETFDAAPYLDKAADFSEPWVYKLHGVLVHSGDLNAGHYYAFLKPDKDGSFFKFDDDRVTRATKKEAIDENFGGEFSSQPNGANGMQRNPFTFKYSKHRFMSAYMLVYIRESRLDQVLRPTGGTDVPSHLDEKIREEQLETERRRKEKEEAHLYMQTIVGTNANFNAYQGFDVFPQLNSVDSHPTAMPKVYRLLKSMKIEEFNKMMAEELGVEVDLIRPWACVGRQNHTTRPDTPLSWANHTLEECNAKLGTKAPLKVWIEVAERNAATGQPNWPDAERVSNLKDPSQPILLFLKYFDVDRQSLFGQGTVYIEKSKKISELGPIIIERMGWPASTNIRLYEEIKTNMIDTMKTTNTFGVSELQNGDIVCFQKQIPEPEATQLVEAGKMVEAPKFYDHLLNRMTITLIDRNDLDNKELQLEVELSKKMTYDQIAAKVGERLKADPSHLRFTTVLLSSNRPRQPVRRTPNITLASILNSQTGIYGQAAVRNDVLLYEVLDMTLAELESKKSVKITLLSEGITKEEVFDVLVPKTGTVRDFVEPLKKKAELSDEDERHLRFFEVRGSQVYRELEENCSVSTFSEFTQIYAERVPQEEIEADSETDRAIYCFHFDKEPQKAHGVPFKFIIKPGELFSATKERLSKRTGIKGKQFEKIKFSLVHRSSFQKPETVEDDDILTQLITTSEDQLGLDHMNKSRNVLNRGDAMMIR